MRKSIKHRRPVNPELVAQVEQDVSRNVDSKIGECVDAFYTALRPPEGSVEPGASPAAPAGSAAARAAAVPAGPTSPTKED